MFRNKTLIVILILGVLSALVFWYYLLFGSSAASAPDKVSAEPPPPSVSVPRYQSTLDGTAVESESDRYPNVVAVMIDNHPDARPQIGLSMARVVYEAPVEGGFTRFMALFTAGDDIAKVGPVRSARPYFINWAGEYAASYWHSGGSPTALATLASTTLVYDVNEFRWGRYFWRDTSLVRPHNLFTNSTEWQAWANDYAPSSTSPSSWESWKFSYAPADFVGLGEPATNVKIPYAPDYAVAWQFNTSTTHWERYENDQLKIDANQAITQASTVIIQFVNVTTIDSAGRKSIVTAGSGEARVFTAGRIIKGTWTKTGSGRTKFLDALGSTIPFVPGPVWVEVVPSNLKLEIRN